MTNKLKPNPELVTDAGLRNSTRIRNMCREKGIDATMTTIRFTLEGALRRIFESQHAERFGVSALKGGAIMFFAEDADILEGRGTKDIDLNIEGLDGTMAEFSEIMREVLATVPDFDDGLRWNLEHWAITSVKGDDEPVPGGTVECVVQLGTATYPFKLDVGFYRPEAKEDLVTREYPSVLPKLFPSFPVRCQPFESMLADKVQAAVRKGEGTGRLRDFYDMTVLLTRADLDLDLAAGCFAKTFALYRSAAFGTDVPVSAEEIAAFGPKFIADNAARWDTMRAKQGWRHPMPDLATVVETIKTRVQPILDRVHNPSWGYAA